MKKLSSKDKAKITKYLAKSKFQCADERCAKFSSCRFFSSLGAGSMIADAFGISGVLNTALKMDLNDAGYCTLYARRKK